MKKIVLQSGTQPEANSENSENRPSQKEISSSNHPVLGAMLVSGRVEEMSSDQFSLGIFVAVLEMTWDPKQPVLNEWKW